MNRLADRVRAERVAKRLSQRDLALKVGYRDYQGIQALESGRVAKPRNLLALAKALDVNPEWLLTGEGDKRPEGYYSGVPITLALEVMYRLDQFLDDTKSHDVFSAEVRRDLVRGTAEELHAEGVASDEYELIRNRVISKIMSRLKEFERSS